MSDPSSEIGPILPSEGAAALDLVMAGFEESIFADYTEAGRETVKHHITSAGLTADDTEDFALVSRCDGRLTGIAKVRRKNHLSMWFVARAHQGRGLGRRLIEAALQECRKRHPDITHVTANSSRFALDRFRHLGFRLAATETDSNGIRYYPVRKDF